MSWPWGHCQPCLSLPTPRPRNPRQPRATSPSHSEATAGPGYSSPHPCPTAGPHPSLAFACPRSQQGAQCQGWGCPSAPSALFLMGKGHWTGCQALPWQNQEQSWHPKFHSMGKGYSASVRSSTGSALAKTTEQGKGKTDPISPMGTQSCGCPPASQVMETRTWLMGRLPPCGSASKHCPSSAAIHLCTTQCCCSKGIFFMGEGKKLYHLIQIKQLPVQVIV